MKLFKIYSLVAYLTASMYSFSQDVTPVFIKSINGYYAEQATGMDIDSVGNIYLYGFYNDSTDLAPLNALGTIFGADGCIVKMDNQGNFIWVQRFGAAPNKWEFSGDLYLGSDGVYIHGAFQDSMFFNNEGSWDGLVLRAEGVLDSYLAKYSLDGQFLWAKRMGEPTEPTYELPNFNIGDDGLYLTSGFYDSINFNTPSSWNNNVLHSNGGLDIYVAKYDFDGNLQWLRSYGSSGDDNGINMEPYQGGYYLCGYFEDSLRLNETSTLYADVDKDAFLTKFNENGDCLWAKRAGGSGTDMAIYVSLIGDELYLSGMCDKSINFNTPANMDSNYLININATSTFLGKYTTDGQFLWAQKGVAGLDDMNRPTDMEANESGVYLTGYFTGSFQIYDFGQYTGMSADDAQDIYLIKFKPDGHLAWMKRAGGTDSDISSDIVLEGNKIYLLGYTWSGYYNFNTPSSNASNSIQGKGFSDIFVAVYEEGYAGLDNMKEEDDLAIYPNPANHSFQIKGAALNSFHIAIIDQQGQIVQELNPKETIFQVNLHPGIYFVEISSFTAKITKKLVVE